MSFKKMSYQQRKTICDKLPVWLKPTPGFRFYWDDSPCIIIGWGITKNIKKNTLLVAYSIEGEWDMMDIIGIINEGVEKIKPLRDKEED